MDVIDVSERLMAEFEDRLPLELISRVVRDCRRDLDCTPAGALPEMLERLARQRLLGSTELSAPPQPGGVVELP